MRAASLNRSDWETLKALPATSASRGAGVRRAGQPILGSDVAGVTEAVGPGVTQFSPGDEILADALYFGRGGFAEHVAVTERAPLVAKPPDLSFDDAAALPAGGGPGASWPAPQGPGRR